MDDSQHTKTTLRQALSGQWQIPLFLLSSAAFAALLLYLRPSTEPETFEQRLGNVRALAQSNRYAEFYVEAETLRQRLDQPVELARLHALAAQTRAKQLRQKNQLATSVSYLSDEANYRSIIKDYCEALAGGEPAAGTVEHIEAFNDLALAYWCLNESDKALVAAEKTIALCDSFEGVYYRMVVEMLFGARPKAYLTRSMELLETALSAPEASDDDRAWAFVRKAEVLIAQGSEEEALTWLESPSAAVEQSAYMEEVTYLRGAALRHAGRLDEAEQVLRPLLAAMSSRGDLYAQTALELGKINYQQYRDQQAKRFYELVETSQSDNDWETASFVGLAECAALQQRYVASLSYYTRAVERLEKRPNNRAVGQKQLQQSLALQGQKLGLFKQYEQALPFLELEQRVAPRTDREAAYRYAKMLGNRAEQLREALASTESSLASVEPSEQEQSWVEQQRQTMGVCYESAAKQLLRVAKLAGGDDGLYGDCLWQAADCYDRAGNTAAAIETWGRFVQEREGAPRWPRAAFQLAQTYQATGQFREAIAYYEAVCGKYPKSLAAADAMVPLAQCCLALEPPDREKASLILQTVLQDPALTPRAPRFRDAMFELGQLYYDGQTYAQAINTLTEAIDRYPQDEQLGKYMYVVGDSYRRSGLALDRTLAELASDPTAMIARQRLSTERAGHLESAYGYFDKAVEFYEAIPAGRRSEVDQMYLRHCWLYRADCLFDVGRYGEAADLYEAAALRYEQTPTALAALAQIVNCQVKLGQFDEARSANQRAIWQLAKMPEGVFEAQSSRLDRQAWLAWFEWTKASNLW